MVPKEMFRWSVLNLIIHSLNTLQRSLSHVSEMHKKDLLYYYIIDLVTSSKKQSIHKALNVAQFKDFGESHRSEFVKLKDIASYTKRIMKLYKASSSKQALKETKKAINLLTNRTLQAERLAVHKIIF
ncbi:hypothetical protein V8B55DRAFT_1463806 [Mucor lusitanicus]|uniref:Uncharacterized protein n=1 Tax=Mucor circinelloides f. lusitanicus TaxID=29924 RepID=A0A8H4F8G2_MUCCL|nr:hypothetical protein FB192DRAFT_1295858 [Mucor lusitanicus]